MRLAAAITLSLVIVACSGTAPGPSTGSTTTSGSGSFTGMFSCGGTSCDVATQLCGEQSGYGPNSVTYLCVDLPSECLTDHTCSCVQDNGGAATLGAFIGCTEAGGGAITVTADLP
jgi:hypothetical protein